MFGTVLASELLRYLEKSCSNYARSQQLAVYSDKKTKSHIEKQVAIEDLQLYANLVKILPGRESTDTRSKQCRDCITYSLVVIHDGIPKRRMADDLYLQGSDAKELINKLKALASELDRKN